MPFFFKEKDECVYRVNFRGLLRRLNHVFHRIMVNWAHEFVTRSEKAFQALVAKSMSAWQHDDIYRHFSAKTAIFGIRIIGRMFARFASIFTTQFYRLNVVGLNRTSAAHCVFMKWGQNFIPPQRAWEGLKGMTPTALYWKRTSRLPTKKTVFKRISSRRFSVLDIDPNRT